MEENVFWLSSYSLHKVNSGWVIDLNVKPDSKSARKKKKKKQKKHFHDHSLDRDFCTGHKNPKT